jgi:Tol biopolymer transport system component
MVYVVNADGSGKRRLAAKVWPDTPAWSPDARKLAFVRGFRGNTQANTDVYVMNADGSEERRLTRSAGYDISPAWSPDGRTIAFVRDVPSDLYVMNAAGSGQRRLARNAGPATWSPDGRKVAFVGRDGIYVTSADGSGQQNLTRGDSPAWSPDGRKIAFVTHGRCCPAKANLYVMNADGSGKRRLAYAPAGISAPPHLVARRAEDRLRPRVSAEFQDAVDEVLLPQGDLPHQRRWERARAADGWRATSLVT